MNTTILDQFGIAASALLGRGSESQVYALDQTRILRVYSETASLSYLHARQEFYSRLLAHNPPFAIPQIVEQGVFDSQPYTIEVRMPGPDLAQMLPSLTGQHRVRALTTYLELATQIGTIRFPESLYGEVIVANGAIQRDTWAAFLWDRIQETLRLSYTDLVSDVPHIDRILAAFQRQVQALPPNIPKALVHGDYFPGNVFIDDSMTVYGVGDFGYSTVVGDPAMDCAGAIIFMEVVPGFQPADTQLLLAHLHTQQTFITPETLTLYRLYYSFYFSHCKDSDPNTYAWCIQNLQRYKQSLHLLNSTLQ